jgi:tetratricopeptide (TPR) repeat protein
MASGVARVATAIGLLFAAALTDSIARGDEKQTEDPEIARAHYRTGEMYYAKRRFIDAAHEFEQAFQLSGRPLLLHHAGKAYEAGEDFARALRAYRRFLEKSPDTQDRRAVEQRISDLNLLVGRLTIRCSVDGATVRIDGEEIGATPVTPELEVKPARHELVVSRDGYATWKSQVEITLGRSIALDVELKPMVKLVRVEAPVAARVPLYKRWWLWTVVGGTLVGVAAITAGVLGSSAGSDSIPTSQLPGVR